MECGPFHGEVFTGLGEGEFYVSIYGKQIRLKLGMTPYPGTLNVKVKDSMQVETLNSCLRGIEPIVIEPPKIPGAQLGEVYAYRASLNRFPVWIVRPAITAYKGDVVEFISNVHLRTRLNLSDGSIVEFTVEDV